MNNKKRLISLTVASAMMLSTPLSVFAAEGDIINTGNKVIYRMSEANQEIIDRLIEDILDVQENDNFLVEDAEGKYLDPQKELDAKREVIAEALTVNNVDVDDIGAIMDYVSENAAEIKQKQDQAVNNLEKEEVDIEEYTDSEGKEEPGDEDLVVESVSAITETVNTAAGAQLEFAINGKTEAADLAKLAEAGYTVEFLASKAVFTGTKSTSADGKLVELAADTTFKYQVKVSKAGEVVAESELIEVTVQDQAKLVTAISAIELYVTQNEVNVKVESGKLAKEDKAKIVVMGRTADMKADKEDAIITEKVTLSTDTPAIATVDNKDEIKQPAAKGDVTITAKAGELVKSITVNAGNAARTVDATKSTVTPASLELATGDSADIVVALKDQYGDTFVPTVSNVATVATNNADGKEIAGGATGSSIEDDLTVKLSLTANVTNAGTGKVVVNHSTTKLAEINLTVKAPGEVADYKLETADKKYELDLKGTSIGSEPTLQLQLNGYDKEGLFKNTIDLDDYSFESSNEKVASVDNTGTKGEVTAVAVGTATITVYKTEDAFKEAVAEVEIEVINSTPSIESVEVKKVDTVTEAVYGDDKGLDLNEIFTIKAVNPEGKEIELAKFADNNIKEDESEVVIGQFVVIEIDKEDGIKIGKLSESSNGKITIEGTGKGTLSISVVDTNEEIKGSVTIEIDIPKKD